MAQTGNDFLGLEPQLSAYADARYAILPVPYDGTVSYRGGTSAAPAAIIEASQQVELIDEELRIEFAEPGVTTLQAVQPAQTSEEQVRRVREAARGPLADGKFLLALGGEHSITPPLVAAAAEAFGPLSVLQIDAHADLRDRYEGDPNSHAAVMARCLEVTDSIVQVGIRSFSPEEYAAHAERIGRAWTPARIAEEPDWIARVCDELNERVYVTIDIDGFDPAFAPGTGTPEPGGLDWRQVTGLLRHLAAKRRIFASDIVEVRPLGANHVTEFFAARLACKLIAYTQQ